MKRSGVVVTWLLSGCALAGATTHAGEGSPDAGSTGGLPATADADRAPPDTAAGGSPGELTMSCFDGDTSPPAFFACDAELLARCPTLRSCCVDNPTCCSPVTEGPLPSGLAPFGDCADTDAATCLGDKGYPVSAFGDPRPAIRGGALMPMGDDSYDSGLVIGEPTDLTAHAIEVTLSLAAPSSCDESCLEAVGVGLTGLPVLGDRSHVQVLAGLLYSAARDEVSLLRGDAVVAAWPFDPAQTWILRVRADGVEVERGGSVLLVTEPVHESSASLIVWGRNANRPADAPLGARITSLSISTEVCDIPSEWPDRTSLLVRNARGEVLAPGDVHAPSIATDGSGRTLVAFERDGNILVAERTAEGELVLTGPAHESVVPRPEGTTYRDPSLAHDATLGWVLHYTLERGGKASIGRAFGDPTGAELGEGEELVAPADGLVRVEQPSVVRHYTGAWVLVALGTDASGVSRIVIYRSADGETFTRVLASQLETLTRRGDGSYDGFAADDVAHPSLVVHDGAWQLYYAGRRGTRWSVGLLVSDELLHWRDVGQVLAGDGNGPDRLGVTAPSASVGTSEVSLAYEGLDGVSSTLGLATRPATNLGSMR